MVSCSARRDCDARHKTRGSISEGPSRPVRHARAEGGGRAWLEEGLDELWTMKAPRSRSEGGGGTLAFSRLVGGNDRHLPVMEHRSIGYPSRCEDCGVDVRRGFLPPPPSP